MQNRELEPDRPVPQTDDAATPPAGVSRRHIIAAGAAAGAALALPKTALGQDDHSHVPGPDAPPHVGTAMSVEAMETMPRTFTQPRVVPPDQSGSADATLAVGMMPISMPQKNANGQFVMVSGQVRAVNNQLPAPTIMVDPGGTIRALMINNLPANPAPPVTYNGQTYQIDACNDPNAGAKGLPFCFNTINLHTHGLHVSPMSVCANGTVCSGKDANGNNPVLASDDVAIEIPPGSQQNYSIVLPDFHAPGTHWYHTHKHGSTAIGVMNGLAGAIIVRDPPGQEIVREEHEDLVWMLQEVLKDGDDQLVYTNLDKNSLIFVNGQYKPTLTMSTGEIQRWRFVNATARPLGYGKLSLVAGSACGGAAQTMNLIAVDGITFFGKPPMAVTEWTFAPGNRADFLVQVNTAGTYAVCFTGLAGGTPVSQVIAVIQVVAGSGTMTMPTTLPNNRPCYLDPINAVDKTGTTVSLQMLKAGTGSGSWAAACPGVPQPTVAPAPYLPRIFAVNCKRYDHMRVDETMTLNTAEEWTITNGGGAPHPFHIHVNPFLITAINDGTTTTQIPPSQQIWWDTFAIPVGGFITIRHRFSTYYGKFVDHCHFLNHEDMGMMQNVEVLNDGSGIGPNTPVTTCTRGRN